MNPHLASLVRVLARAAVEDYLREVLETKQPQPRGDQSPGTKQEAPGRIGTKRHRS